MQQENLGKFVSPSDYSNVIDVSEAKTDSSGVDKENENNLDEIFYFKWKGVIAHPSYLLNSSKSSNWYIILLVIQAQVDRTSGD